MKTSSTKVLETLLVRYMH